MTQNWSIEQSERIAGYLGGCFDELYRALGQAAPQLRDDAVVVVSFELAREFATVRVCFERLLAHRAGVDERATWGSSGVIESVLSDAVGDDDSGALLLYATSMFVTPRLLVSLRDAVELAPSASGGPLVAAARVGADALISASRHIGEVASRTLRDPGDTWRESANRLETLVDGAGFAESFGLGLTG